MREDNFIEIPFTINNLDRYVVRRLLLTCIKESLPTLNGSLLDAGCGKMPYKSLILKESAVSEYTGLDIENARAYDANIKPDFVWNGVKMPFNENVYDCCMATEVLEHCPEPEVFLGEVFRVLKSEGSFFFTVPFIWNLHEVPHDEYRYTPFSLARHMTNVGFSDIEIKGTGGWHAALALFIGLWVRRSGLNKWVRITLSFLFMPLIRLLLFIDSPPKHFREGSMITGLYGTARKRK